MKPECIEDAILLLNVTFTVKSCEDAFSNSAGCIGIGSYRQIHQIGKMRICISGIVNRIQLLDAFQTQCAYKQCEVKGGVGRNVFVTHNQTLSLI